MLTIYRRHHRHCPSRRKPELRLQLDGDLFIRKGQGKCCCPLWVDGFLDGEEIRKSLRTRNWLKAQQTVQGWMEQKTESTIEPMSIQVAEERFLADARARQLHESTLYKYKLLFKQIEDFATTRGLRYLKELDLPLLDDFRSSWKDGPRSGLKKLERVRAFFRFCERRKWIGENPADELKPPKIANRPTLPFTRDEMLKILAALDQYARRAGIANAQRLKAFLLLLRYSGMRIGDAVRCSVDRINGNKLLLYTQKTGIPVFCILPDIVLRELEAAPKSSENHFFWTGKSKLHSAIGKWQRRLQTLFILAGIKGGHAHRLRHTFSIELLLAGVPLERVSVLLGHQSLRVTERHYAAWVRSRQEQLESDLQRAWSQDPMLLTRVGEDSGVSKSTFEVHEKTERIN
jgi:integrase/recombinase XerD